ncbi:MAG TPA: hypothetical protein DCW59_02700 [Alteromonas sp.]|nr:hypothetical protein [Alteromonas sp.]
MFHSAGIISSTDQRATIVRDDINGEEHVTGSLVRVSWKAINPSEGVFDFTPLENELAAAAELDASISLAILDSKEMPQYVMDQCETFDYTFRGEAATTCLPWDSYYQQFKAELVSRLGAQFDSHPNLRGVYMSYAAMSNGIEMHWRVDENEFTAAGYTPDRLEQSYNDVMDMYAEAFATTPILMEIHTVFDESHLAENAFNHCYDTLGSRCGVAIWWCASRMATDPRQAEYPVYHVAQQATELSFAVCQTIGNFSTQPDRFDSGQGWTPEETLRNEMDFFIGEGFKNFEIWSADLKDESLMTILETEYAPLLK